MNRKPVINFERTPEGGKFSLTSGDVELGYLVFVFLSEDRIDIEHTVVKKEFEGNGYGRILVMEAKNMADKNNWKIVPSCSYAAHVLNGSR